MPSGMPPGQFPGGALPSGAVPSGQPPAGQMPPQASAAAQPTATAATAPAGMTGGSSALGPLSGSSVIGIEVGERGVFRLFNRQLAGQTSLLLPLALLGLAVAGWQERPRSRAAALTPTRRQQALVLWGVWLLSLVVFFSETGGLFHRYYLVMLAPAVAALSGIGAVALWAGYRRQGWGGWLLPAAVIGLAGIQALLLRPFPDWSWRLTPLVLLLALVGAAGLAVARARPAMRGRLIRGAVAAATVAVLIVPTVWCLIPVWQGNHESALPYGGPSQTGGGMQAGTSNPVFQVDTKIVDYLRANRGGERYLFATLNSFSASPVIIATGEPVMALGGFTGGDPIVTPDRLATLTSDGTVRYFLLSQTDGMGGGMPSSAPMMIPQAPTRGNMTEVLTWVNDHCATVPPAEWQSDPASTAIAAPPGMGSGDQSLFDCHQAKP
jgi:4-amino-4-deoxy-L-arabinose transferase-like glycosyltransferase